MMTTATTMAGRGFDLVIHINTIIIVISIRSSVHVSTVSHGGLLGYTPPPLNFHGAGGRGRRPWLCKHAPSSRTGADGPQAEERDIAADAHCIAQVLCDKVLFHAFLAEALKKNTVCPVVKKSPAK